MVVGRDFLLRMAAALLEEAQSAADPQEAEVLTQRAHDGAPLEVAAKMALQSDLISTYRPR